MANYTSYFSLVLLLTSPCMAKSPHIQDSKKAVEFFKNELEFRTNPFGVKLVMDGIVKNVTIVDVRSAKDFQEGHIPGAINIAWNVHDNFEGRQTEFTGLRKDGYNYIYCYAAGCPVGARAAVKFASLGYPVKEIVGGFEEWKESGLPVER